MSEIVDWIFEYPTDKGEKLSPEFLRELNIQLLQKGDSTGIKNFAKYDFQIGLNAEMLNLEFKDNYAFAHVDFITPTSFSFPVIIAWRTKTENFKLETIHSEAVTNQNIEFYWTKGFPLKQIEEHIQPYRKTKSGKNKLEFNVEYYYNMFPDIELQIITNTDFSEREIDNLNNKLLTFWTNWNITRLGKEIESISKIKKQEGFYSIIFDFGLKNSNRILNHILEKLSENSNHKIITIKVK